MRRKLKALGLALMAVFAISAVAASAAQAVDNFTAEKYNAAITGHQEGLQANNYFEITEKPAERITCKVATYEGTLTKAAPELTIHPHYEECEGPASAHVNVHLDGCDFVFHVGETTTSEDVHGTADVICPAGKEITVDIGPGLCKVDIPEQKGLKGITYTNKAAEGEATPKKYITVHVDVTKEIKYKETKTKLLCPFTNNFEGNNGSYFSTILVKGYEDLGTHTPATTTDANGETTATEVPTNTEGAVQGIDIGA